MTKSVARSHKKFAVLPVIAFAVAVLLLIVIVLFAMAYFVPTDNGSPFPEGFTPIRDDALAAYYAPAYIESDTKNPIRSLYYRAAQAEDLSVFIAYHPVWAYEKNETGTGLGPFLSRWVYTGGLCLQQLMFGKGDVETIAIRLDADLVPVSVWYEYPEAYNVDDFFVRHKTIEASYPPNAERLAFAVISWNHLFDLATSADGVTASLTPQYFTDSLWTEYAMVKTRQTRIQKNRAHYPWERLAVK